jgi:serine/threonine protein kinase
VEKNMNLKIIILLLLSIASFLAQEKDISLIKSVDNIVSTSDSLRDNNFCELRAFVKTSNSDIPAEIFDFENWPENIIETYNIFTDSNKTPVIFIVFPYSESGDWSLTHSFYFDSSGKTVFYQYYLGFFNSICTEVMRKYIQIYFNDNFELITKIENYEDENNNT